MSTDLKKLFLKALEANKEYSEAHLQLALIYEIERDNENVVKHFQLAISSYKKEIKIFDDKGESLLKNFQFQNAKVEFSKSQDKKNLCANVFYHQGKYYLNQSKIEDAKNSFYSSLQMNQLNFRVHLDLGKLLMKEVHLDDARFHLEKAISLNYGDSDSHYCLALIMLKMKDVEDAEQHFLSALDILIANNIEEAMRLYKKIKIQFPKIIYDDLEK